MRVAALLVKELTSEEATGSFVSRHRPTLPRSVYRTVNYTHSRPRRAIYRTTVHYRRIRLLGTDFDFNPFGAANDDNTAARCRYQTKQPLRGSDVNPCL